MDAQTYFQSHGRKVCERVAKKAGTNWPYFKQMVYRVRKPGSTLARKLVVASLKETPAKPLALEGLLFPPAKRRGRAQ